MGYLIKMTMTPKKKEWLKICLNKVFLNMTKDKCFHHPLQS